MDEFLMTNASYIRLRNDYMKHGSLVVGFDFDGTVYDVHNTGAKHEMVRQLLRDLKEIGCKLICWTANPEEKIATIEKFLIDNNIPFDGINTNGIELGWTCRKPFFSVLLDDRAGLLQVYKDLTALVNYVKYLNSAKDESIQAPVSN